MLTAVTGIKWGDEGKGRVIDLLAERADIVVRYQGGNNAGHTVVTKQGKFILNLLPSGILHPNVVCVLADGMVVDLEHLSNEIADIRGKGVSVTPQNFKLSARATISMPWHRIQDDLEEERLAQSGVAFGSTRRGIAYAYSDKYRKKTLRLGDNPIQLSVDATVPGEKNGKFTYQWYYIQSNEKYFLPEYAEKKDYQKIEGATEDTYIVSTNEISSEKCYCCERTLR